MNSTKLIIVEGITFHYRLGDSLSFELRSRCKRNTLLEHENEELMAFIQYYLLYVMAGISKIQNIQYGLVQDKEKGKQAKLACTWAGCLVAF